MFVNHLVAMNGFSNAFSSKNSSIHDKVDFLYHEDEDKSTFESVLSLVGFGKYQIGVFVIVGVIGMCDAGESQALSLVLPILEDEWGITALDESLMGSFVYAGNNCIRGIGYLVGSLLSGFVGDRFGRRHPIVISSAIMFTVGMAGAFMPNFVLYTVFRVLLVACVGFIIPISFSALAENTPMKQRGYVLVCIGIFYTMGELTVCLLAYLFMPTLTSGNWRAVLAWSCVPALISFLIAQFSLFESPRYLLIKGKAEQARNVILQINKRNGGSNHEEVEKVTVEEYKVMSQQLLLQLHIEQPGSETNESALKEVGMLLQQQFRRITLIVWYQWMASSLVFAGITFLLPLTLKNLHPDEGDEDESTQDLNIIILSVLGELPTLLIATVIVNISFLGRKRSLAIAYFSCGLLSMLIYFLQRYESLFRYAVSGAKLSINLAFTINYEYTSELYPTYIRASGIGMASAVGKIGSIVMPWIVVYISEIGIFTPYLIFGSVSALAAVLTMGLPFDTFQRELDKPV